MNTKDALKKLFDTMDEGMDEAVRCGCIHPLILFSP